MGQKALDYRLKWPSRGPSARQASNLTLPTSRMAPRPE
jgi:hypothetical protein